MKDMNKACNLFITGLRTRASALSKRIVLSDGEDLRIIAAAHDLLQHSLLQPVLVGRSAILLPLLKRHGMSCAIEIYDPHQDPRQAELTDHLRLCLQQRGKAVPDPRLLHEIACDPVYCGALLVKAGYADGMVGGATVPTASIIRAGIQVIGLDPCHPVVSGSFVMLLAEPLAAGQQALVFADAAVIPQPSAQQLAGITINTAHLTYTVLGQEPVAALLSFSTYGSAEDSTVTKVREALQLVRQALPKLCVDGEMQIDAALIPEISERKAPGNLVRGRANVLIFPNLDAGNAAYKLVERVGRATALGVILSGLAQPLNDLSRGCNSDDIVNMISVTALQSAQANGEHSTFLQQKAG